MSDNMNSTKVFSGNDAQLLRALRHMATRKNLTQTDRAIVNGAVDTIEDLIAEIREARDYE